MSDPAAAALAAENRRIKEELETMKACYEAALGALHTKTTTPTPAVANSVPVATTPAAASTATPVVATSSATPASAPVPIVVVTPAASKPVTASTAPAATSSAAGVTPLLTFQPNAVIDKVTYQGNWARLPIASQVDLWLNQAITSDEIEALLKSYCNIITFASGQVGHTMKFFLFGKDSANLYLIQMEIDTQSGKVTSILKTDSAEQKNIPVLTKMLTEALVSVTRTTPTQPGSPLSQASPGGLALPDSSTSPGSATSTHPAASPRSLRPRFTSSATLPPSVSFTESLDFSTNFSVPASLKHTRATSIGITEEIDPNAESRAPSRSQFGREEGQMVTPMPAGQNGLDDSSIDFDTKFVVPNGIPRTRSFMEYIDSGASSIAPSVRSSNADLLSPLSLTSSSRTTSGSHRKNVQSLSSYGAGLQDGQRGGQLVTPNSAASFLNGVDDPDMDFSTSFNVPAHVRHARAMSSADGGEVIDASADSKPASRAPSVRSSNADLFAPLRKTWDQQGKPGSGPASSGASSGASSDEESNSDSDEEFYEFAPNQHGHAQGQATLFNGERHASISKPADGTSVASPTTATSESSSSSAATTSSPAASSTAPPPVVRRVARPSVSAFQKPVPATPATAATTTTATTTTVAAAAAVAEPTPVTNTPAATTSPAAVAESASTTAPVGITPNNISAILTEALPEEPVLPKVKEIPQEVLRQRELASGAAAAMAAMQAKMAAKRGGGVVVETASATVAPTQVGTMTAAPGDSQATATATTTAAPVKSLSSPAQDDSASEPVGSIPPAAGSHFVFVAPTTTASMASTPPEEKEPEKVTVAISDVTPAAAAAVATTTSATAASAPVQPSSGASSSVASLIAASPQLISPKIILAPVSVPQVIDFNVSATIVLNTTKEEASLVVVTLNCTPVYASESAAAVSSSSSSSSSPNTAVTASSSSSSAPAGGSNQYLISKEVYDTEARFVSSMSILQEVYITPCSSAMNTRDERIMGDTIFDTRIQVFFATATQILKLNSKFLSEIKHVMDAWTRTPEATSPPASIPTLSSVILNYAPLFQIFSSYAKDHEIVSTLLLNAAKPKSSDPIFEKFVARTMIEGRTNGQPLNSLLVQAVQRPSRYKLLLDELLKRSSPSDRGYNDLKAALEQVGAVAMHANETIRHREQNEALEKIEEQFDTSSQTQYKRINLRDREPPRHLIREGSLIRLTRSGHTSYYFHLFNDCLLYSDIKTNGLFKLHRWVNFYDSVAITDKSILPEPGQQATDANTQYAIEVRSPSKSFLISFFNRLEKDAWLHDLLECLQVIHAEKEAAGTQTGSFVAPVWTQDEKQTICGMKGCGKEFSLFNRRHHCRICGNLVCALCSKNKRMLPSVDEKKPVRVCDACVREQHEQARQAKSGGGAGAVANGSISAAGSTSSTSSNSASAAAASSSSGVSSVASPNKRTMTGTTRSGISALLHSSKNTTLLANSTAAAAVNNSIQEEKGDGHDEENESSTSGVHGSSNGVSASSATPSASDSLNPLLDESIPEYRRSLFALSRAYPNDPRLTCAIELYLSEITYCKELEVLISHFVTPLLKQISTGKKSMLSNQTTTLLLGRSIPPNLLIFLNAFQPLYTLALELHKLLHAKIVTGEDASSTSVKQAVMPYKPAGWNPATTTFGALFLRFANLFDMYVEYSSNHQQAVQTLTDSPDENILYREVFLKYENEVRSEMEKIQAEQAEMNEYAKKKERAWASTPQAMASAAAMSAAAPVPTATPASSRVSIVSNIPTPINLDEPHTHTSLHDLLTAPFMRVSKYVWLLSSLLRATPEGHPDNLVEIPSASASSAAAQTESQAAKPDGAASFSSSAASSGDESQLQLLATSLRAVQKSLNNINGAILTGDNLTKLTKLQDRFVGNPKDLDLIAPHRFLIKEGMLVRHTRKGSERYLFHLLSDLLLYSEVNVQGKYKLHRRLPLMTLQCVDSAKAAGASGGGGMTDRCSFEIHSPIKSFVIVASTEIEKNEWIEQIMLAIRNEEKRSLHASTTLSPKSGTSAPTAASPQREVTMTTAPLWAKDSTAKACPIDGTKFTAFTRRHHCRSCGTVCCDKCSPDRKVIASLGELKPVRVCVKCAPNFK